MRLKRRNDATCLKISGELESTALQLPRHGGFHGAAIESTDHLNVVEYGWHVNWEDSADGGGTSVRFCRVHDHGDSGAGGERRDDANSQRSMSARCSS